MQETQVWFLGQADPLVKEVAPHSSILPWTEEPGRLQSMGSQELDITEQPNHHTVLNNFTNDLPAAYPDGSLQWCL